jgi:LuxR family maltose regulon positive regulatory protein
VRVLVDEGVPLGELLRELIATRVTDAESQAFIGSLLAQIDAEHHAAGPDPDSTLEMLSSRELEVLGQIADGLSNKAIAAELVISLPTVKTHVGSILTKLGAKNRTEAVAEARRHNLLMR